MGTLGKTAGGLFWMFRYLERSENLARLVDAGFRISLTRSRSVDDDWASVAATAGVRDAYLQRHTSFDGDRVIDFLLRDRANASSVLSAVTAARSNARMVRTALTREVFEATNECWLILNQLLADPVRERDLPDILDTIRRQSALVRGALHGTMLRNDIFNFARLGTFIERADNTARLLDVKYYVLLPSVSYVGSSLDNLQWETILRSASAHRAYQRLNTGDVNAAGIAELLILDQRLPRSLAFCCSKLSNNLDHLAADYMERHACHDTAETLAARVTGQVIEDVFDTGLHEFLSDFINQINALGRQIEDDYRFSS